MSRGVTKVSEKPMDLTRSMEHRFAFS